MCGGRYPPSSEIATGPFAGLLLDQGSEDNVYVECRDRTSTIVCAHVRDEKLRARVGRVPKKGDPSREQLRRNVLYNTYLVCKWRYRREKRPECRGVFRLTSRGGIQFF
uniref:Uncharacterized protein n=1 Tax=Sipha flava TaxID=143950 RepID=A0A2S2QPX2_9HEMI